MSATIAAALKKIAVSLLTDKRALKVVGGIILGIIIIVIIPIAAFIGIFSGDFKIDTDLLRDEIMENMSDDLVDKLERLEDTMTDIEDAMTDAGFEERILEAQALYMVALSDKAADEDFVEHLVGCFADDQSNEELIEAVNDTFGTNISVENFERVMSSMSTPETETDSTSYTVAESSLAIV